MSAARRPVAGRFVCFAAAFRQDGSRGGVESPNITHVVLTGATRTLCGRADWATEEGPLSEHFSDGSAYWFDADCLRCNRTLQRLRGAS